MEDQLDLIVVIRRRAQVQYCTQRHRHTTDGQGKKEKKARKAKQRKSLKDDVLSLAN